MAAPSLKSLAVPVGIEPMEAKLVTELPDEPGWQFEPKWDGFRCLAFRAGREVDLRAKSGKPLARYFPEVVAMLAALKPKLYLIDRVDSRGPEKQCAASRFPPDVTLDEGGARAQQTGHGSSP